MRVHRNPGPCEYLVIDGLFDLDVAEYAAALVASRKLECNTSQRKCSIYINPPVNQIKQVMQSDKWLTYLENHLSVQRATTGVGTTSPCVYEYKKGDYCQWHIPPNLDMDIRFQLSVEAMVMLPSSFTGGLTIYPTNKLIEYVPNRVVVFVNNDYNIKRIKQVNVVGHTMYLYRLFYHSLATPVQCRNYTVFLEKSDAIRE